MSKVAIVTDSTAVIPDDLVEQYNIRVAPQVLIWGEETLLDGVDIQPEDFYNRLLTDSVHPTTSQVTPGKFREIFGDLLEKDHEILAILISENLSGTIDSACQALEFFPGSPIEIVDSKTVAMALGFQALMAARAAQDGASLAECKAIAKKGTSHTGVVFTVNTLEYLHRGGRIGGGTRFLGTALNIKPILEVKDGAIEAVERIRTRKKSLNRVVELIEERVGGRKPVRLASLHANAPEEAHFLLDQASARLEPVETVFTVLSPVVGTHAGPGTLGLTFMAGM
ncbi:MAG TPA: DegV family protein [Anaerolineales bacterium]|nr:DegV family protein [Anaerolineales bacterium]